MEWVQGMNEAVNYIEEHILEEGNYFVRSTDL